MKLRTAVILVAVIIAGYYIYKTDTFQRQFFPKRYWQEQVESTQSSINLANGMLRDTAIELVKLQMTAPLKVAQEINFAKSTGMDVYKARKMAVDEIKIKVNVLRDQIKTLRDQKALRELLEEEKKELEHAKKKLAEYQ